MYEKCYKCTKSQTQFSGLTTVQRASTEAHVMNYGEVCKLTPTGPQKHSQCDEVCKDPLTKFRESCNAGDKSNCETRCLVSHVKEHG